MYRSTALIFAKMLMRRYEHQKQQVRYMETVFRRIEGIWNFRIDTDKFKVEDMNVEKAKPAQSSP